MKESQRKEVKDKKRAREAMWEVQGEVELPVMMYRISGMGLLFLIKSDKNDRKENNMEMIDIMGQERQGGQKMHG